MCSDTLGNHIEGNDLLRRVARATKDGAVMPPELVSMTLDWLARVGDGAKRYDPANGVIGIVELPEDRMAGQGVL